MDQNCGVLVGQVNYRRFAPLRQRHLSLSSKLLMMAAHLLDLSPICVTYGGDTSTVDLCRRFILLTKLLHLVVER
jgi:hypothetical protein